MTTIATRDVNALFERTELQKKIDAEVLARVKKGFLLLQEKHGDNWIDKIDMRSLKLSDGSCCILGQVYGDYEVGLGHLNFEGYDWLDAAEPVGDVITDGDDLYGFTVVDGDNWDEDYKEQWGKLDEAWKAVLNEAFNAFA